jgi:hypothetical protein
MSRSALKFLTKAGVAPEHRLVRQPVFCTNRTQERKRNIDSMSRELITTKDKDVVSKNTRKGCGCHN